MVLFVRCTATNPSSKNNTHKRKVKYKAKIVKKLNYGFILKQMIIRCFRRVERKILKSCIRRKYLVDPRIANGHVLLDPLIPFPLPPLVTKEDDDSVAPDCDKEDDFSFCSLCNFHVKKPSKHCRTCNRCVEGFDHHCRVRLSKKYLKMWFITCICMVWSGMVCMVFTLCYVSLAVA